MGGLVIAASCTLHCSTPSSSSTPSKTNKARIKHSHYPPAMTTRTSRPPPLFKHIFQHSRRAPTSLTTHHYAELASKLARDGRLDDFLMITEAVTDPSRFVASLDLKRVSHGVSTLISDGRLHSVIQFFNRLQNLGVVPSTLVDNSVNNLLASECRRLLKAGESKEAVTLIETLAGFLFSVKKLVKASEIFKLCVQKRDTASAVRYACMLPNAPILLSSIILEFGKKRDLMSAINIYEASKCMFDVPNMYMCRTVIDVCGSCGDLLKSRYIYEDLLAQKVTPNTYVFNSLMNVNAQELSYVWQVYKHMKDLDVTPDLTSYNILLKSCYLSGRVDLAQDIYEEVRHMALMGRLKLDVITYSTTIKVFADAKMWQRALKIKEDMISDGVKPNMFTWSSLISACANAGLVEQATLVFEEMLLSGCEPNSQCYNSLLYACVEACQYDRAFRLFQSWRGTDFRKSFSNRNFRKSYHKRKCNTNGQSYLDERSSTENGTTNSLSCYPGRDCLNLAKVVTFKPTVATFNILLKACGTDYHRAKALMDEIKLAGLSPNNISWSILIDICGTTGNVRGSIQALQAMHATGIKPDVIAYTTAIKGCVRNKSLKLAFALFEEMKRYRVKPNLVTYDTLLRARRRYGSLHEVQQSLAIYQDMRKAGYSPNDYFLKELIEEWCEGVVTYNNQDEGIMGRSDLHNKTGTETEAPQSMFLEKVAAHLQRDISQNLAVDLRGLTRVEARIVVLAVLRVIKEHYIKGDVIKDDIVINVGVEKEARGPSNHTYEVQDAVVNLLQGELGLDVEWTGPRISTVRKDLANPFDTKVGCKDVKTNVFPVDVESSTRRPDVLRRVTITRRSLYLWLQKRVGKTRR